MLFSGHITQLFRTGFVIWLVCEPTSAGMHWACTRWFLPLSCVTLRPSWSDSWHWFILFIMPGINLTLHPCHSRNSFISRCFDVKTMAHSVSGVRRFEDVPDWNFLLWLLSEIKTLDEGECGEEGKKKKRTNNHLSIFQGCCLWLSPHSPPAPTAPREPASSSLALMRQATVTVTSELSACNIHRVCVLANVICAHTSVTDQTDFLGTGRAQVIAAAFQD